MNKISSRNKLKGCFENLVRRREKRIKRTPNLNQRFVCHIRETMDGKVAETIQTFL
jgi:hypothetical protein